MRQLTVRGAASEHRAPNTVEVIFRQETLQKEYTVCSAAAARKADLLRKAVAECGLDAELLKTTEFRMDTRYDSERTKDGNHRQVFVGFVCNHSLVLRFPFQRELLDRVLEHISARQCEAEFNIRFTLRDGAEMVEAALQCAVADALRKAEVLAGAAGLQLGAIQTVDYGTSPSDLYSPTRYERRADRQLVAAPMNFCPEDIEHTETVLVTWEIVE